MGAYSDPFNSAQFETEEESSFSGGMGGSSFGSLDSLALEHPSHRPADHSSHLESPIQSLRQAITSAEDETEIGRAHV